MFRLTNNSSDLKIGQIINIIFKSTKNGKTARNNCLVINVVKDRYFDKGLITYLHNNQRNTLDLKRDRFFMFEIVSS